MTTVRRARGARGVRGGGGGGGAERNIDGCAPRGCAAAARTCCGALRAAAARR
jgi:hypothetical protein